MAEAYRFTQEQLDAVAEPADERAPRGSWGYVRNVLGAVDRFVPGMSGATVAFVARECFGYLTDARLRQTFDDGEGDGSWGFWALVDLDASDRDETVRLNVISVGER